MGFATKAKLSACCALIIEKNEEDAESMRAALETNRQHNMLAIRTKAAEVLGKLEEAMGQLRSESTDSAEHLKVMPSQSRYSPTSHPTASAILAQMFLTTELDEQRKVYESLLQMVQTANTTQANNRNWMETEVSTPALTPPHPHARAFLASLPDPRPHPPTSAPCALLPLTAPSPSLPTWPEIHRQSTCCTPPPYLPPTPNPLLTRLRCTSLPPTPAVLTPLPALPRCSAT